MPPHSDPIARLEYFRSYNAARKEKDRQYRITNRQRIEARRRERYRLKRQTPGLSFKKTKPDQSWEKRNPDKVTEQLRRWRAKYPEKAKAHNRRSWQARRARKVNASVNPRSIEIFISGIRSKPKVACYYCGKRVKGSAVHFDHIIPLSKGGAHSVENLCASCPKCNLSKQDTVVQDWMRLGQQVLAL